MTGLKKQICFNIMKKGLRLIVVLTGLKKQICFNIYIDKIQGIMRFDRTEKTDLFQSVYTRSGV